MENRVDPDQMLLSAASDLGLNCLQKPISPKRVITVNGKMNIKRVAGEYEAKRISEAEQKRAQRKARAKASPTELSSSDLSCSICNRQFRAKIGLISHLRTHK